MKEDEEGKEEGEKEDEEAEVYFVCLAVRGWIVGRSTANPGYHSTFLSSKKAGLIRNLVVLRLCVD